MQGGHPGALDDAGIELFASGQPCTVRRLCAWELGSCWVAGMEPRPEGGERRAFISQVCVCAWAAPCMLAAPFMGSPFACEGWGAFRV